MKRIIILLLLFVGVEIFGCTSAIITGRLTPDGRPLMWKHRDTEALNNRMEWFKGDKYSFLGLVNSDMTEGVVWGGSNDAGFSIMNTASFNLQEKKADIENMEGVLMYRALGQCKTLADFEKFLNDYPTPRGVEGNFGVIDANGGAAYYEVNNYEWVKVDVNDERIAPHGYLAYTNFSYTGKQDGGYGYIRYETAERIISKALPHHNITPKWIFDNLSRSFYNSFLDVDYAEEKVFKSLKTGWIPEVDFISRRESSSSFIMQGVKPGEDVENTIIWVSLGYPPVTPSFPLFIKAGENQPHFVMKSKENNNAALCDVSLAFKEPAYANKRGSGPKYVNLGYLKDSIMDDVKELEKSIYEEFDPIIENMRNGKFDISKASQLYEWKFIQYQEL